MYYSTLVNRVTHGTGTVHLQYHSPHLYPYNTNRKFPPYENYPSKDEGNGNETETKDSGNAIIIAIEVAAFQEVAAATQWSCLESND